MEEHSEKKEGREVRPYKGSIFDSMRENPWMPATIVLVVVLAGLLIFGGFGGISGNIVSEKEAGDNLIKFVNSQGQGEASVVSAVKEGTLYKVTVSYNGQDIPVYVTLDGKYLITTPIPLTGNVANDNGTSADQTAEPQDVPKSDKPVVELFIMSYCPYGTQAEKGIIPVVESLKDKIDFKVKFVYYAMHPSQGEVEENTRQYCIEKEQSAKFLPYLKCFLKDGDSASCLTSTGVDKTKLNSCYNATDKQFNITALLNDKSSWMSGRYPQYNVDLADNEKYGIGGSPTLVVNGQEVSSARDSASFQKVICSAFNTAPEACKTALSSETPSPGFGYSTSGSAGSGSADCGA